MSADKRDTPPIYADLVHWNNGRIEGRRFITAWNQPGDNLTPYLPEASLAALREELDRYKGMLHETESWEHHESAMELFQLREKCKSADFIIGRMQNKYKALEARCEKLEKAINAALAIDCPNYIAHPQSVWWTEHVVMPLHEALAEEKKDE